MFDRDGASLHERDRVIVNSGGQDSVARISQVLPQKRPTGPSAFGPAALVVWEDNKSCWLPGDVLQLEEN